MKTVSNFVQIEKRSFPDSVRSFLPQYAYIPCNLSREEKFSCIVSENDVIEEGQVIAYSQYGSEEEKVAIHSSVPGSVVAVEDCTLLNGNRGKAVKIRVKGSFSFLGKELKENEWQWYKPEEILALLDAGGVLNTFGKTISLYRQISECEVKKGRFLVIRLFDDDPSYSTDSFIFSKYTEEITKGAVIVARAMKAQGIIFAVPRKSSIRVNAEELNGMPFFSLEVNNKNYPAGFSESLIHLVKKAGKSEELKKFDDVNHFCVFADPSTLYSAYEAIAFGKPSMDTFVHVGGSCVKYSGMFKVKVGTTLKDIVRQCGGFKVPFGKVIVNGMILGFASSNLDMSITKEVKSVAFVPASKLSDQNFSACVRCGNCRNICPENIFPDLLFRHSIGGKAIGRDLLETSYLCSGCCLCNSVCPSRLPLCQIIELIKENRNESRKNI